jgi:hypothetical protein
MNRIPPTTATVSDINAAQEKLDQLLHDQTSWIGEVANSLERSEDPIKQRMQYFDRLAVLSGAILAFSVPAFTSLRGPGRVITHRYTSLGCAIAGWAFLFVAMAGAALTHYLLVEHYAVWTTRHQRNVQNVLFHNLNLIQKRLMRAAGGKLEELKAVPVPVLSFHQKAWHDNLSLLLNIASVITTVTCLLGILNVFTFLLFSSF